MLQDAINFADMLLKTLRARHLSDRTTTALALLILSLVTDRLERALQSILASMSSLHSIRAKVELHRAFFYFHSSSLSLSIGDGFKLPKFTSRDDSEVRFSQSGETTVPSSLL